MREDKTSVEGMETTLWLPYKQLEMVQRLFIWQPIPLEGIMQRN